MQRDHRGAELQATIVQCVCLHALKPEVAVRCEVRDGDVYLNTRYVLIPNRHEAEVIAVGIRDIRDVGAAISRDPQPLVAAGRQRIYRVARGINLQYRTVHAMTMLLHAITHGQHFFVRQTNDIPAEFQHRYLVGGEQAYIQTGFGEVHGGLPLIQLLAIVPSSGIRGVLRSSVDRGR